MMGDKRLEMPKTNEGCLDLLESFVFEIGTNTRENTRRLVELNNEVYDKLHKKWSEGYNQRIQDEQEEQGFD